MSSDSIVVRALTKADLEDVIRIDAKNTGKPRQDYYRLKLDRALADTSVMMSLAAEEDGMMIGFLMGSMYFGDFGVPEHRATIDAIAVHPDFARRGVASALWRQFTLNAKAMRIDKVETIIDWSNWELLTFFQSQGFAPSSRLSIEMQLDFTESEDT